MSRPIFFPKSKAAWPRSDKKRKAKKPATYIRGNPNFFDSMFPEGK